MSIEINFDIFTTKSKEIFDYFLTHYTPNKETANTYRSAFTAILKYSGKNDITQWDFDDYSSAEKNGIHTSTGQIFKFLYAKDCLENENGFDKEFENKDKLLEKIESQKSRLVNKANGKADTMHRCVLSIDKLEKIFDFVNGATIQNLDDIRYAFFFYLLFDLELPVKNLKGMKCDNYKDGSYTFENGDIIEIPQKFTLMFDELNQREANMGFNTANYNITHLGEIVGIPDLTPADILKAKTQRTSECPECGDKFLMTLDNWVAINNYLVCKNCAEELLSVDVVKKNEIINSIPNFKLEFSHIPDLLEFERIDDEIITIDELEFSEGEEYYKKHIAHERNPRLIKLAKAKFIQINNGRLFCEVCGFNFHTIYGELGQDFIEVHHVKPVSLLCKDEKTKISDIIMVCSNCHSMLHRKKPWLGKEHLKEILSKN